MQRPRPRWSGPRNCPPERGFFGLSKVEAPAREDHLEGAAIVSAWLGDRDEPGSWEASYAPLWIAGDSAIATESRMA
jgi:hypothetical protein